MTPEYTPPSSDPLFGNAASDLLREAAGTEGKPPSDPRFWQPPTPEELQSRLEGYVIEAFLARGGMGAVYRGMQTSLERAVAIKILPPMLQEHDANFALRFKQEARAMAQLNHPGIVKVFDFGEMSDGTLYFIMEFIDGTDVAQMVARQGRLSSAHALAVTAHVCDALQYAHELGIVHRDIKPANIMVGIISAFGGRSWGWRSPVWGLSSGRNAPSRVPTLRPTFPMLLPIPRLRQMPQESPRCRQRVGSCFR